MKKKQPLVKNSKAYVEGLLCVYGSTKARDAYGTFFTAQTDFCLGLYRAIPLTWDHGEGYPIKVGELVKVWKTPEGIRAKAALDLKVPLARAVWGKVRSGKFVGFSPMTFNTWSLCDETSGHILRYPLVEATLSFDPAQGAKARVIPLKADTKTQDAMLLLRALEQLGYDAETILEVLRNYYAPNTETKGRSTRTPPVDEGKDAERIEKERLRKWGSRVGQRR